MTIIDQKFKIINNEIIEQEDIIVMDTKVKYNKIMNIINLHVKSNGNKTKAIQFLTKYIQELKR